MVGALGRAVAGESGSQRWWSEVENSDCPDTPSSAQQPLEPPVHSRALAGWRRANGELGSRKGQREPRVRRDAQPGRPPRPRGSGEAVPCIFQYLKSLHFFKGKGRLRSQVQI